MKKKNVAIVFGITNNYDFALANVLLGMKKHCKKFWDDIIVFHIGLSSQKQDALNKILKCKFIDYQKYASRINIDPEVIKTYSLLTFARFECFNLLKEYKNVIWHDVDILVQDDFSDLMYYCDNFGLSTTIATGNFYIESNFNKLIPEYDMFLPLYNAGIMCMSDKLEDYENMTSWCYNATSKYADYIRFGEQGIINLLILDHKIKTGVIDILKYCCHPLEETVASAAIVHAYGTDKFWNSEYYQTLFPEWNANNLEWEKISNSKTDLKHNQINNSLVSVIMTVYQRIDYLYESVLSILNQTYENLELIIVIEKSPKTAEIEKYIKETLKDSRIRIIKNTEKLGFAESLNVAIKHAKGKYIARMDDDDISLPTRIEKEVAYMNEHPEISIVGSWMKMFMYSDELCVVPLNDMEIKSALLVGNPLFHPTIMFREADIKKNNMFYSKEFITEDYDLWTRMASKIKFANIGEVLLKYRASKQNSTVQNRMVIHNSVISIMKRYYEDTLDLTLSKNEIELIYGYKQGLLSSIYNQKEALKMLQNAVDKIIKANQETKFFDEKILQTTFYGFPGIKTSKNVNKKDVKYIVLYPVSISIKLTKKALHPLYVRLMKRVDNLIEKRIAENNQLLNVKYVLKDKTNEQNK